MNLSISNERMMSLIWCLLIAYVIMLMPSGAWAQEDVIASDDPIADILCNVVGWFTGSIGQAIATLAIIVIGIGALMGKVSWGMAIIVGIGVAVIFGAPAIVENLAGDAGGCGVSAG